MDVFSQKKERNPGRINEADLLAGLQSGQSVLGPLKVAHMLPLERLDSADARITLSWDDGVPIRFVVEAKSHNTPLIVRQAILQARHHVRVVDEHPLVIVPYLSPHMLDELDRERVSGIDLCGNGLIIVPGRLYVRQSGHPNIYPESRPLSNPYRGQSALVARMLLVQNSFNTLAELVNAIRQNGGALSLSQASKAVHALQNDVILAKLGDAINLISVHDLLNRLGREWRAPIYKSRMALRLPSGVTLSGAWQNAAGLSWAITGESSASHYLALSQSGPRRIVVTKMALAREMLGASIEPMRGYADVELLETDEPGFYFMNHVDAEGMRWASSLQTWLELQAGDARQKTAAADLYKQLQEISDK